MFLILFLEKLGNLWTIWAFSLYQIVYFVSKYKITEENTRQIDQLIWRVLTKKVFDKLSVPP